MPRDVLGLVLPPSAMQSVHQAAADEGAGEDHGRRPDEERPEQPAVANAKELGREAEEDLVGVRKLLAIVNLLGDEYRDGVCCDPSDVGHSRDDSVLLHVEGTRIERPCVAERAESCGWKRPREELATRQRNDLRDKGRERPGRV